MAQNEGPEVTGGDPHKKDLGRGVVVNHDAPSSSSTVNEDGQRAKHLNKTDEAVDDPVTGKLVDPKTGRNVNDGANRVGGQEETP